MPSWIYFSACSIWRFCFSKFYNKNLLEYLVFISLLELIFIQFIWRPSLQTFFCYAYRAWKQFIMSF